MSTGSFGTDEKLKKTGVANVRPALERPALKTTFFKRRSDMYIGQKIIKRAPFRWGIVGGGSTSNVGYKHRLGAMRDNTSFVLTAAAFDVDFERGRQFGIDLWYTDCDGDVIYKIGEAVIENGRAVMQPQSFLLVNC